MANLACLALHPHPVRTDDLDHPDELRVDLDPVPGVPWSQVREVAGVAHETLGEFGLTGWPKTSGSRGMHINVRIERRWTFDEVRRAALALAREIERRAPDLATSKWWKEERHGVFVDYNQNAKDRTVASAYSVRPLQDARVSAPLAWDEVPDCEPEDFTIATMPSRFAERGDLHEDIDRSAGTLDALLELAAEHEAEGLGDAPWPPHYQKQKGEPPRVQPSRRRTSSTALSGTGRGTSSAESSVTGRRTSSAQPPNRRASKAPSSGTGRRTPKHPLIEIARAQKKEDALAGLERWKARHPEAAAHLEPADVLVDAMRGRYTTWT